MKIKLLNGNGNFYNTDELKIVILNDHLNNGYLSKVKKETGIEFDKSLYSNYVAYPKSALQVVKLLTHASTFKFMVNYCDNWNYKNTIFLKMVQDEN